MARPKKNAQNAKEEVKTNISAENTAEKEGNAVEEVKTPNVAETANQAETFSKEQVQDMIAKAVAEATQKALASVQAAPQIIQVASDTEKVQFLFQAEVSDENIFEIGQQGMYGRIIGKTGVFFVPKNDLSRVMDSMFRLLMEKRWIIAVDGLTDAEREAYGVDYKEGELLDRDGFRKMVELGDGMLEIYPKLCKGHREMVAKRYHEEYAKGNPFVTRSIVVELNRMSKQLGSESGDFTDIIEAMNEADKNK